MSDINVGEFSEALNDKMDRDGNNPATGALENIANGSGADFVVEYQAPTAQNDYTWYRLYASGWVEQGGQWTTASAAYNSYTVTLPVVMNDTSYYANAIVSYNGGDCWGAQINNKTIATVTFLKVYNSLGLANWEVKGMSARGQS